MKPVNGKPRWEEQSPLLEFAGWCAKFIDSDATVADIALLAALSDTSVNPNKSQAGAANVLGTSRQSVRRAMKNLPYRLRI